MNLIAKTGPTENAMLSTESRLPSLDVDIGIIVCRLTGGQLATLCMRHGPRSGFGPECQASADPLGMLPDSRQPRNLFSKALARRRSWRDGMRFSICAAKLHTAI